MGVVNRTEGHSQNNFSAEDIKKPELAASPSQVNVGNDSHAGFQALLNLEAAARQAQTPKQLHYLFANETRKLTRARQVFCF